MVAAFLGDNLEEEGGSWVQSPWEGAGLPAKGRVGG